MMFPSSLLPVLATAALFLSTACSPTPGGSDGGPVPEIDRALLGPYLERPSASQPRGWQTAVKQMDEAIAKNPGELVLVNQLRVRQAMLLTVNAQQNQATQKWSEVDPSALRSQRDRALYQCREALVWAYKTLPQATLISSSAANPRVQTIDDALRGSANSDVAIYLETVRAEIQLKLANSMDEERDKAAVENTLATSLQRFVEAFPRADQQWVQANPGGSAALDPAAATARHRIWLRQLIRTYRAEAADKSLAPAWQPTWIGTLPPI